MEFSKCFVCVTCNICFSDNDRLLQHQRQTPHPAQHLRGNLKRGTDQDKHELRVQIHRLDTNAAWELQSQKVNLSNKTNIRNNGTTRCSICETSLSTVSSLKSHVARVHQNKKRHECQYCCQRFFDKRNCTEHELIHKGHKSFKCGQCDKPFFTRSTKDKHIRRVHNKEVHFKCKYCNKTFYNAYNGRTHEQIHTDQKPYKCKICFKKFSQSGSLNRHVRCVH